MKSFSALVLSLALLLVGGVTQAATFTANCSDPNTNLQNVINSVSPGDTIMVNGTCTGQFTINQPITLQSVAGPSEATLNGNQGGSVLTVSATSGTVTLNDLIITNGTGTRIFEANTAGGGIYHTGASTLTLNGVTVNLNQAGSGSGIDNEAGSLILSNSSVINNQCCAGGLTGGGGGILMNGGSLMATSSSVSHNQTVNGGGGIYINAGVQVTLNNSSLKSNVVKGGGGGGILNAGGVLTIDNGTLAQNSASANGGGIDNVIGGGSLTNSSVSMNTAANGGGICNETSSTPLTLVDTTVINNTPNDFCQ